MKNTILLLAILIIGFTSCDKLKEGQKDKDLINYKNKKIKIRRTYISRFFSDSLLPIENELEEEAKFDIFGNCISEISYDYDISRVFYKYNSKHQLLEKTVYKKVDEKNEEKKIYKYDTLGKLIYIKHIYDYLDSSNNGITEYYYDENGKDTLILEEKGRKIIEVEKIKRNKNNNTVHSITYNSKNEKIQESFLEYDDRDSLKKHISLDVKTGKKQAQVERISSKKTKNGFVEKFDVDTKMLAFRINQGKPNTKWYKMTRQITDFYDLKNRLIKTVKKESYKNRKSETTEVFKYKKDKLIYSETRSEGYNGKYFFQTEYFYKDGFLIKILETQEKYFT